MFRNLPRIVLLSLASGAILGASPDTASTKTRSPRLLAQVAAPHYALTVAQTLPGRSACVTPVPVSTLVWETRSRELTRTLAETFPPLLPLGAAALTRSVQAGAPPGGAHPREAGADQPTRDQSARLLYLYTRFHYNAVGHMPSGARLWTAGELDVLLGALHDFPANEMPLDDEFRQIENGHVDSLLALVPSPVPGANLIAVQEPGIGAIRLAGQWHDLAEAEQRGIIFHELAHDFAATAARYGDWKGPWKVAQASDLAWAAKIGLPTSFVSRYAEVNLDEDMAESAVAYRYQPAMLKMRAPARYELLRTWMFDGLEYFSSDKCRTIDAFSEKVSSAMVQEGLGRQSAAEIRKHVVDCSADAMFQIYDLPKERCWLLRAYADEFREQWERLMSPSVAWAARPEAFTDRIYFLNSKVAGLGAEDRQSLVARHLDVAGGGTRSAK